MVTVGEIVAAHGLYGEVRVQPLTDFPERFHRLAAVWVSRPGQPAVRHGIRHVEAHRTKPLVILALAGISTREQARALTGAAVEIEDDQIVELPAGVYFEHDIVGLNAVTTDGQQLGPVTEVLRTGANDVYVTPRCLIPAIPDVIARIDLEAGCLLVHPVPGLLDE